MQKQHRVIKTGHCVSATPNIQSVWNKFCSDELIRFSCKLLFCKIQNHYRGHEKSENRDLKRRKLYTLILTLWNSYVKSVIIHLWRQVKAHLSKTRKKHARKTDMRQEYKKKSLIQRHRHTRINTNNPNVSKLKVRISTGQIQVQKNQILVFKLEFTIKKNML